MCIRDRGRDGLGRGAPGDDAERHAGPVAPDDLVVLDPVKHCLLYTSDAADERSSVDLGGRRIIKKKKKRE